MGIMKMMMMMMITIITTEYEMKDLPESSALSREIRYRQMCKSIERDGDMQSC
jgi:hypothetical protein